MNRRDSAMLLIEQLREGHGESPELLIAEAQATRRWEFKETGGKADSTLKIYERARQLFPEHVDAWYLAGEILNGARRNEEAYPLMKEALRLSPKSRSILWDYEDVVRSNRHLSKEEIEKNRRETISILLERSDNPANLKVAGYFHDYLEEENERDSLYQIILDRYPDSKQAEDVQYAKIGAFRDLHEDSLYTTGSSQLVSEYRDLLRTLIDRKVYHRESIIGHAYLGLYNTLDSTSTLEERVELILGMEKYEKLNPHFPHQIAPIYLAEQDIELDLAERLVRDGFEVVRKKREQFSRPGMPVSLVDMKDALGFVLFKKGDLDEAEAILTEAYDETNGKYLDALLHLGQLYELRYDQVVAKKSGQEEGVLVENERERLFQAAFEFYQQGTAIQTVRENPSSDYLENLYVKHYGNSDDFDAYLEKLSGGNTLARKSKILTGRLSDAKDLPEFELEYIDGGSLKSEALRGTISVINFWYTQCAPCVWELPEYQQLHERYKDDELIQILTINTDRDLQDAKDWMTKKEFDFATLIHDGFANKNGINSFPTSWFIDREGKIVFEVVGWSKHLYEEFTWRIESMR